MICHYLFNLQHIMNTTQKKNYLATACTTLVFGVLVLLGVWAGLIVEGFAESTSEWLDESPSRSPYILP